MALEFIKKDKQFRVKLQVNFIEKVNDPAGGKEEGEGMEQEVEVYVAQSGDGKKKASQPKKVVEFYTNWLTDTLVR